MAMTFSDLSSASGLKNLDEYLLNRNYITGYEASKDDLTVYAAIANPPSSVYPNVARWFNHVAALLKNSGVFGEGSGVIVEGFATEESIGKKKESGKSSVLLDIKPLDDETDMKELEKAVRSVEMEGLTWGESKLVPMGYGMNKLQIMFTVVDDLVSVDVLIDGVFTAEPFNDYISSCDIVVFNKI